MTDDFRGGTRIHVDRGRWRSESQFASDRLNLTIQISFLSLLIVKTHSEGSLHVDPPPIGQPQQRAIGRDRGQSRATQSGRKDPGNPAPGQLVASAASAEGRSTAITLPGRRPQLNWHLAMVIVAPVIVVMRA
jgi:hypothetical protein